MSEPVRIALVAEGPTDWVVIEAAIRSILGERPFVLTRIFPEPRLGGGFGALGSGWSGVYRWCRESANRGLGRLQGDRLAFVNYDILNLHLDADVAGFTYASGDLIPDANVGRLPCAQPCPPAEATTNVLRQVLLSWCGEVHAPERVVICMPAMSTEAWVVAALFPSDVFMNGVPECFGSPEGRLSQQRKTQRIRKSRGDYQAKSAKIEESWHRLVASGRFGEASRFQKELLEQVNRFAAP